MTGTSGRKNVRSAPRDTSRVLFKVHTGQRIQVIGQDRDRDGYGWYKVYVPSAGAQGWIAAHLVNVD